MLAPLPTGLQGFFLFIPWLCLKRWEMHKQGLCCYQAYRYKISTTPPSSSCFGVKGKTSLWGGCVGTGPLRRWSSSARLCWVSVHLNRLAVQCRSEPPLARLLCSYLQPGNKAGGRKRQASWLAPHLIETHFSCCFSVGYKWFSSSLPALYTRTKSGFWLLIHWNLLNITYQ